MFSPLFWSKKQIFNFQEHWKVNNHQPSFKFNLPDSLGEMLKNTHLGYNWGVYSNYFVMKDLKTHGYLPLEVGRCPVISRNFIHFKTKQKLQYSASMDQNPNSKPPILSTCKMGCFHLFLGPKREKFISQNLVKPTTIDHHQNPAFQIQPVKC